MLLVAAQVASAIDDLETTKKKIMTILDQECPDQANEYTIFFQRYDALVFKFFDCTNHDSLKVHLQKMESEMVFLQQVCEKAGTENIRMILKKHANYLLDLIELLKKYVGSKDTISLALRVRKFKPFLPQSLRKKGDLVLLRSLHHRLRCST